MRSPHPTWAVTVLPQLYVRQIPRALVLAANGSEAYPEAASLISATGPSMYSSDGDAEFGLDELEYQLSSSGEQLTELLESLRLQNRGADLDYTLGRNTTAAAQYAAALAQAYTYTDFANLIASLDAADDFLHAAIASGSGAGTNVPSMLAMATLEPLDDIVSPLFGSIVTESAAPSVTVRSAVTGSKAISYYDPLITLDAGGSIPRTTAGGFPAQDDEDEEWDPRELPDNLPSYPISGGGDPTPETPGLEQGTSTVVYSNDEVATGIEAEILHAYTYQQQALAGLNFLGFDPNMVPAWRFDWLLSQARYYCERADGMQQRALGLLGSAEATYKEEYAAETSALVAGAGVEVANAQKSMAAAQADSARVIFDAAENAYDRAKSSQVWETAGAAIIGFAGVLSSVDTFGGADVTFSAALGSTGGQVTGGSALASGVASSGLAAQRGADSVKGAADQVKIAEAGQEVADDQLAVSQQLLDLAVLEATRAEGYLDLLATLTLNSSAYYVLQDHIGKISTSYLRMANRMAWLAQQALQWESRKRTSYILQSYIDEEDLNSRFGGGATLQSHIDAMEHDRIVATTDRTQVLQTTFSLLGHNPSALAALRALGGTFFQVDQKTLDLRFPGLFLHSLKSIEVEFVGLFPANGVQAILRSCNNARVRVPNDLAYVNWFGLDPVPYEDWAYPAATYAYDQDVPDAAGFVMKPLLGSGFSKILSEYRRTESGAIVSLPEGEADQLENVPVEVMWSLELPRASNAFPLENIVDVRFTLYFTAKHSEDLAARQRAQLEADPAQSGGVLFAATVQAASSFAAFVATPLDRTRRDVRILSFPLSARDFPANTRDRVLENFHFALVGLSGDNMKVRLASTVFPITERQHTSWADGNLPAGIHDSVPDGMLFSAVGDADILLDLVPDEANTPETVGHTSWAGTWPALDALVAAVDDRGSAANLDAFLGTWVLKVLPEHNTDRLALDDDGEPAESAGTELRLASGTSSVVHETGSWLHVAVEATVQLQEDRTLGFVVRDNAAGTGADRVVATLHLDAGVLTVTVTCGTISGVRSASVGIHDDWYKARLEVVGTSATLLLDGVPVPLLVGTALVPALTLAYVSPAKPGPGTVRVTGAGVGSPLRICDLTVTRLRYDGTPLEVVVDERFADLDAWTATAATVHSVTLHALDLSFLREVLFQVDFTSVIDFIDSTEVGTP